jgi:PAS domain S-box-containing protein
MSFRLTILSQRYTGGRQGGRLGEYSRTLGVLENLFDQAPVLFCVVKTGGTILDCNEMYATRTGYLKSELIGIPIFDQVSPNSLVAMHEYLERWEKEGHTENCEIWLRAKDGTVFPALLNATSLHDEQRNIVGCSIALVDETDIYRTRKDIEKANEELKHKEQLKNEFIAIASHELRTPIQPILGFALLAKKGKITQDAAWDGVLREARRLQQLANDILDVSRIESSGLMYKMEKIRIYDLLEGVTNSEKANLAKDIALDLIVDKESKEIEVELDRSRITQVLTNMIGNASKFTQKGSIKVESTTCLDKNKIEIKISDTGGGIPESVLPKLFGKFVTKSVGESNKNGTGLGLFICKAIVSAHGGEVYASNNGEGGATFVVTLPIEQSKNS